MTSSANPELPFDAVYVINVRSHPERWDSARRQLRAYEMLFDDKLG